jgi:rubrerythrin
MKMEGNMSVVFSGDEIIEMAVRTEATGYAFYSLAKKNAKSTELKDLFGYLAEEELNHKTTYEGMTDVIGESAQGVPVDWDELGFYIQSMIESSLFLGADKNINLAAKVNDDKQAIDFALGFEKDTLLFFYQLRDLVKTVNKPVIEKIIKQEQLHIQKLSAMKRNV